MVTHKTMSLFDAPVDAVIVHACNSQGVWGSGIAKPFKEKYPKNFADYNRYCQFQNEQRGTATGTSQVGRYTTYPHWVGCLITSHNYGDLKDSPELIKINTTLALQDLCRQLYEHFLLDIDGLIATDKQNFVINVYSNKFNSGLFAVPWEDSELILKLVLRDYPQINWVVCSQ